jgi:hypothetical protein
MAIKNGASRRSLQNQTVGIKTWVHTTEYHPIQQTPGKRALLNSPAELELSTLARSRKTGLRKVSIFAFIWLKLSHVLGVVCDLGFIWLKLSHM